MSPAKHIRKLILRMTQEQLGNALSAAQSTVAYWDKTGRFPSCKQAVIRQLAKEKGIDWDDRWFFEPPRDPDKCCQNGDGDGSETREIATA